MLIILKKLRWIRKIDRSKIKWFWYDSSSRWSSNAFTLAEKRCSKTFKRVWREKQKKHLCSTLCTFKAGVLNQNYLLSKFWKNKRDGYKMIKNVLPDGNVITSRGPATVWFCFEIVKTLKR